jgi:hypothetical protein
MIGLGSALVGFALANTSPSESLPYQLSPEQVSAFSAECRTFGKTGSPLPGLACLIGDISETSQTELQAIEDPWRILVANSPGGDLQAGIEIGRLLHTNMAALIVDTVCLSSCANYLVPGSRYLYVMEDSVIALHGSAAKDYHTFGTMRASALGLTREDLAADPSLVFEIFDQYEAFRQDFVIPESDFFVEIYTPEGYLNRYWEVRRTLDYRPDYSCRPKQGLFLVPGPVYFEAFSIDVIDMWWPDDRTALLGPIERYLDNYSVILDFDEHPTWDSETGIVNPARCDGAPVAASSSR